MVKNGPVGNIPVSSTNFDSPPASNLKCPERCCNFEL